MKSTGMVRAVDPLGRIVIPKEIRDQYNMTPGKPVEIFTNDNMVIFKPYAPGCVFCGEIENVVFYMNQRICRKCLSNVRSLNK